MRKAKIICTIGPASESEEVLEQLMLAGMNVARLNFSHGSHEEHLAKIERIRKVREKLGLPIAIMLDTKGPEYRIGTFRDGKVTVETGSTFTFTVGEVIGDETKVSVSHKKLNEDLKPGDRVLVNNGLVVFEVREISGPDVICETVIGGVLSNKKSMSFPNKTLSGPYLSENDKADLLFGIQNDVDFVAASFVSTEQDVVDLRNFLDENGGQEIEIISKIENRSGIDHIDAICAHSDGIMVAHGDLGVEVPFVEVPAIQKELINKCRLLGKRVITATEMLESMITNPRPTRAEISDVANAVYDGCSAIMLSGETAVGKYPVEAVKDMAEIAAFTETQINYAKRFRNTDFIIKNTLDAMSHAVCSMGIDLKAKCIAVCTRSGTTVRMVSRFRNPIDIIGITPSVKTWRKLAMSWGVTPVLSKEYSSIDVMFYNAVECAKGVFDLKTGDKVVVTGGLLNGHTGNTNTIKLETIE